MQARQTPTFEVVSAFSKTDADMASKLASAFFGEPMPWQKYVLNHLLARNKNDKFINHAIALSIPRQNGKSWIVRALCFYCLIAEGAKILYTCQHGDTADEMFKALSEPFEDEDNEELHDILQAVRKANGQQAIYLNNGGYVRFSTRTNSLARGRSFDKIIYDEAQDLTSAQQAASLPTLAANKKKNAQVIYMGTPPNAESLGTVFKEMHEEAHSDAQPGFAWLEWSVDEIGDVTDRRRWYETNPSLGRLIDESSVQLELSMAKDDFARERLGWWSPVRTMADYLIGEDEWLACLTDEPPQGKADAFAVKFSPDGSFASIAAAIVDGGITHVELVHQQSTVRGIREIADMVARNAEATSFVIDGRSGAQALIDRVNSHVPSGSVELVSTADMIAASAAFLNGVREQTISWFKSNELTEDNLEDDALSSSVLKATRRSIGASGGWGFGGEEPTAIEACALAAWAAKKNVESDIGEMEVYF